MDRRIFAGMAGLIALWCLVASPASAGTYAVHACSTAAGRFTNHSWAIVADGVKFNSATCTAPSGLNYMWVGSGANKLYDAGENASMTFTAPAGASIVDFRIHRYLQHFNPVDGTTGRSYLYSLGQLGSTPFEATGQHDAGPTLGSRWYGSGAAAEGEETVTARSFPALANYSGNATFLRYTVGCHANPCALMTNGAQQAGSINAQIFGATVTVNDPTVPKVDRIFPTGLRTPDAPITGDEPLTFDATDNAGIAKAQILDVTPGQEAKVVGTKDFACDYTYATPCPTATGAEVLPKDLPAGARTLKLRVTDGAGNSADSDTWAVNVGGPLNGTPANAAAKLTATFARNKRSRINVGFGKRASVRGRLTDPTGAPIANATIQVLDRQLRTGSRYAQRLELTTDGDGRFSVLPGPGTARAIRFEYRSRRLLAAPNATDTVSLRVAAGATLRIRPKTVRPRGSFRISGRLKGLPIPRSGKLVDLQAFENGKWRTFETARARQKGFSARYRFLRAGSGRSFLIRARIRRDDSYPYYLGYSPRVRVRVR